eukprot:CAMPEP_0119135514 /NCGR_PEP_ID=MMETSP1310-20130426/19450_1 /TAXON_ID=464262 /ORGANISM="Genus nov. species nov., Strain RCC2339" /LENGTH=132 /DNA_ID=CAMNT_0007126405 /DNA_START=124 /DNA_END=518 /DNA_ORIENTATION=+
MSTTHPQPGGPLPPGWQVFYDNDGQAFYYNPELYGGGDAPPSIKKPSGMEGYQHPIGMGDIRAIPGVYPDLNKMLQSNEIPLPDGWEEAEDDKGRKYYIDHNTQDTTWEDPRERFLKDAAGLGTGAVPASVG